VNQSISWANGDFWNLLTNLDQHVLDTKENCEFAWMWPCSASLSRGSPSTTSSATPAPPQAPAANSPPSPVPPQEPCSPSPSSLSVVAQPFLPFGRSKAQCWLDDNSLFLARSPHRRRIPPFTTLSSLACPFWSRVRGSQRLLLSVRRCLLLHEGTFPW
jgi:hypothetical protein